jgi:hypothetical protein
MNTLKELEYANFVELVDYLKSISGEESEEGKLGFALQKIGNFFPELTSLQELEMGYVIDNLSQETFERFKDNNPDIKIDTTGKSTPTKKDYWEIKEKSLSYVFDMAYNNLKKNNFKDKHPDRLDTQIYNAKTLSPLKNMEKKESISYAYKRTLFFKKFPFVSESFDVNRYEGYMSEMKIDNYTVFFNYLLSYCYNKKYKNFSVFLEHVLKRIETLYLDKELKSNLNKEYLESIKSVINKNN